MSRKEIRQKLEEFGETTVRSMLADGHPLLGGIDSPYQNEVLLWLAEKTAARAEDRAASSEARSDESVSISRSAFRNSQYATIIAIIAIIVAARSAIADLLLYLLGVEP